MAHNGWERRRVQVRQTAEAARQAQHEADRLAIIAWNERMYVEGGPAQPSPTIGQALAHGYRYLRVRCSTCRQSAWLPLAEVRRPNNTPVWKLEGALACRPCRERGARAPRGVIERLTREKSLRDGD
jgi:hypothetical protein